MSEKFVSVYWHVHTVSLQLRVLVGLSYTGAEFYVHIVVFYNIKSITQPVCLAVFSVGHRSHARCGSDVLLAARIPVVRAAGPCETLSSLLTVMLWGQKMDIVGGMTPADPQGKQGWSKRKGAEEKAWKGEEEGPVAGGTEEGVRAEAGPEGWKGGVNRVAQKSACHSQVSMRIPPPPKTSCVKYCRSINPFSFLWIPLGIKFPSSICWRLL